MANKVKFGLKNVHYAVLKSDGTYETPKAIEGAVNLSMDAEGEINKFYADNLAYYQQAANNGYSGELEIARIPDSFKTDVLKEIDSKGVGIEKNDAIIADFALGFQVQGDAKEELNWLLKCTVTRPSTEAATTEDSITPKTDKLKFTATARDDGKVRTHTTDTTKESDRTRWFTEVVLDGSDAVAVQKK